MAGQLHAGRNARRQQTEPETERRTQVGVGAGEGGEGREKLPDAEMGRWWELAGPTLQTEAGTQQTRRGWVQGEAQTADAHVARNQAQAAGREGKEEAVLFHAGPVDWHWFLRKT